MTEWNFRELIGKTTMDKVKKTELWIMAEQLDRAIYHTLEDGEYVRFHRKFIGSSTKAFELMILLRNIQHELEKRAILETTS